MEIRDLVIERLKEKPYGMLACNLHRDLFYDGHHISYSGVYSALRKLKDEGIIERNYRMWYLRALKAQRLSHER